MSSRLNLRGLFIARIGTEGNDLLGATYERVNTIHGMGGDDTITGGNLSDFLYGGTGHDRISAGGGNDILQGGAGRDTIQAGAGDDLIYGSDHREGDQVDGGTGFDTISYENRSRGVDINLGAGLANDMTSGQLLDTLISIENARGTQTNDMIVGSGAGNRLEGLDGYDYILGGGGNDFIDGGNAGDVLYGGMGDDTLLGGAGNDELVGEEGADLLDGGSGIDTAFFGASGGGVLVNLETGRGHGGHAEGERLVGIENLSGSNLADTFFGNDVANVLNGWGGKDSLYGHAGNDTLIGGLGADTIAGGAGGDVLWGGQTTGADQSRDVFAYLTVSDSRARDWDRIMDFDARHDVIDLSAIDANPYRTGNNSFAFIGDDAFGGVGQVSVRQIGGDTWVYVNTDANVLPEMAIRLDGLHDLTAANFIL